MRFPGGVGMVAAAVLIGGCSSGGYDVHHLAGHYSDVTRGAFRYAGAGRDFETVIVGNPFAVPQAVTERAVLDAMRGRDKGMGTNFTTAPRNALAPYRVVMALDRTPGVGIAALCRDPTLSLLPSGVGAVSVTAVFCAGDRVYFAVGSSARGIHGPDDAAFRRLVDRVMYGFVPYESMIDDDPDPDP